LETGESFYALSPSSHLLGAKAIRELCSWQRSDGTLYSPVPSGNWNIELPQQMLASVGWFGFWNYYMNTGDKATVAASYPAAKRYVLLWDVGRNGLLSHRPGKWNQGDWGENVDINLLESCWYYLALKGLAGMAEATGGNDDLRIYEEKMRFIRDSFRKNYWNPMAGAYRSPGYTGESDDRANALAVVAGLADAGDYQALRKVLMSEFHASPYMEKYVIEALFMMGYEADALTRMKKRYAEMVQSPLTTLWEGWKLKSYDFGGGTYNHAWSGGPLTLLSMYVAGVRPIKPGYEEYEVMPALDSLTSAECIVPSVRGQIRVAVEKIDGGFMLDLESPSGTRAIVGIPSKYSGSIMITDGNGEMIDYSNPGAKTVKLPADSDGRYARFMVWPGKWKFSAKIY
jgi:hypothetical protein